MSADLRHLSNWIFDLDDTLYPSSPEVYAEMTKRIRDYLMDLLHVSADKAWEIQKDYYVRYGATACGLMKERHMDPAPFIDYIHTLDLSPLHPDPALRAALEKIDGKRFIFTNGAHAHARRVLDRIGLSDLFSDIFSIEDAGFIPKPNPGTYRAMLERFKINAEDSVMFDDNQKNLLTAHQLGLTTVWITSNKRDNIYNTLTETPDFCDYRTPSVSDFLKRAAA